MRLFPFVKFLKGEVPEWPKIIATTLSMKNKEYPLGWPHTTKNNPANPADDPDRGSMATSNMEEIIVDKASFGGYYNVRWRKARRRKWHVNPSTPFWA